MRSSCKHRVGWGRLAVVLVTVAAFTGVASLAHASTAVVGLISGFAGKCVGLAGASANGSRQALLTTCNSAQSTDWAVAADETIRSQGRCLDVDGGNVGNGTRVQLWDCNGTPAQRWERVANGGLRNPHSGSCLDVTGFNSADGTPLQIWACAGTTNQQWTLPTRYGTVPDNLYMTAARLDTVQVAGTTATVRWTDQSNNEAEFQVYRRDAGGGAIAAVAFVASATQVATGQAYSFVDTIPPGTRQCYEIGVHHLEISRGNVSNEVCTSALTLPGPPARGSGTISTPDMNGLNGQRSSVAIGSDGLGIASYWAAVSNGASVLRVAHCLDLNCTAAETHDVDTSGSTGRFSSIGIGGDGLALISYAGDGIEPAPSPGTRDDLRVAHCVDVACTSATVTVLDTASTVDDNTSLSIVPGGWPVIAYQDNGHPGGGATMRLAVCLNPACTSAAFSVVDRVGSNTGGWGGGPGNVSAAIGPAGAVYVAYHDDYAGDLKMAVCPSLGCVNMTVQTLDAGAAGVAGQSPAVRIGRDGLPLVSYESNRTSTSSDLIVGHCVNVFCTAMTTTSVHTGGSVGWNTAIAIGADGLGVISYADATNWNVEVAHCADLTCTRLTHTTIDGFGQVGVGSTSVAIGADGLPLITYSDTTNGVLKVVHCGDAACAQPLEAPFLIAPPH